MLPLLRPALLPLLTLFSPPFPSIPHCSPFSPPSSQSFCSTALYLSCFLNSPQSISLHPFPHLSRASLSFAALPTPSQAPPTIPDMNTILAQQSMRFLRSTMTTPVMGNSVLHKNTRASQKTSARMYGKGRMARGGRRRVGICGRPDGEDSGAGQLESTTKGEIRRTRHKYRQLVYGEVRRDGLVDSVHPRLRARSQTTEEKKESRGRNSDRGDDAEQAARERRD